MSALHWFEIPVTDFDRAKAFYETVLGTSIQAVDMREQMGSMLGMLPPRDGVGGALVQNSQYGYTPSAEGTLVYLNVDGDLNNAVGKVEASGGKILLPKTAMGQENGFTAWITDTEGNKVGLYSTE
jgi:predicted enzyme related to lactoylglutathione lyase